MAKKTFLLDYGGKPTLINPDDIKVAGGDPPPVTPPDAEEESGAAAPAVETPPPAPDSTVDQGSGEDAGDNAHAESAGSGSELPDEKAGSEGGSEAEPGFGYFLAKQLQSDGNLGDDFEITAETDIDEVYSRFRQDNIDKFKQEAYNIAQQELVRQGISPEELTYARAIRNGIDPSMLSAPAMHRRFSGLTEEATESERLASVRAMYQSRQFSDVEAERLITAAKADDQFDAMYAEATQYHGGKWQEFKQAESQHAAAVEKERQRRELESQQLISRIFNDRKLLGRKLTTEQTQQLHNDIYATTEVVTVNNQQHAATPFQKFLYEFNSNEELQLFAYLSWKSKDGDNAIAELATRESANTNFLKQYEEKILAKQGKGSTQETKPTPAKKKETPQRSTFEYKV